MSENIDSLKARVYDLQEAARARNEQHQEAMRRIQTEVRVLNERIKEASKTPCTK